MTGHDTDGGDHIHFEGGVPVLETPLQRIEREQAEAKQRDKLYKDEQLEINRRQLEINRQQLGVNTWLMTFTFLLVITSTITSLISLYQARISRISANAARDAVGVASRTLGETQRSNTAQQKIASDSFKATVDNFHLDQRAWIGPKGLDMKPMQAPNPIASTMTITNSGKTPALRVEFLYYLHPSDGPINVVEYIKHPVEKGNLMSASTIMLPGATYVLSPETGSTDALGVDSVKNGRKLIYFFVFISYVDVFGAKHHTRACALYQGKAALFSSCPGNFDHAD